MLLVYLCFSSGVYLYFRILMYVKRHEQFQIGCGAILNKNILLSLIANLDIHRVVICQTPEIKSQVIKKFFLQ